MAVPPVGGHSELGGRYVAAPLLGTVSAFDPEYVVVSLGVDPADGDPTAGLCLTTADFAEVGRAISAIDRPLLIVQEGGYQLHRVGADVRAVFDGLGVLV